MIRPWLGPGLAVWLLSAPLAAQSPIRFTQLSGEAGAHLLDSHLSGESSSIQERTWQEWVRIRMSLFLLDPRLVNLTGFVQPVRTQSVYRVPDEFRRDGESILGSGSLDMFRERTINGTLTGERSFTSHSGRFGDSFDLRRQSWSATLRDRDPIFPTRIRYEDRILDLRSSFRSGLPQRTSDERTRTLRFEADNRKTGIIAERMAYEENRLGVKYIRRLGRFDHRLQWGKGSRLRTILGYLDRSGMRPFNQLSWSEALHLQHLERLSSEYTYKLSRLGRDGQQSQYVNGRVAWQPAQKLQVELEGIRQYRASRLVRQEYTSVVPTVRLALPLPLGARLRTWLSAGYEWHSQDSRQDAYFDVLQEPHTVGASGQFRLEKPFADPASLVVSSADGRELYQEGIDFRAVGSGPFVEVIVLPTGRISEGDVVHVDYRVNAQPTAQGNAWTRTVDTRLELGPVALFHQSRRQDSLEDLPPGTLPVLQNWERSSTGLSTGWSGSNLNIGFEAERGRNRTDFFDYGESRVSGSAGVRFGTLSFSGMRYWLRREDRLQAEGTYTSVRSQATLEWWIADGLRLSGFLTDWTWQGKAEQESITGGGGSLNWTLGRFLLDARFDRIRWANPSVRTESRFFVSLKRGFQL